MPLFSRIISSEAIGSIKAFPIGALDKQEPSLPRADPLTTQLPTQLTNQSPTQTLVRPPSAGQPPLSVQPHLPVQPQAPAIDAEMLANATEQAYRKGFSEGRDAARREQDQISQAIGATLQARVERLTERFDTELEAFQQHSADAVLSLAIELARQATLQAVRIDRTTIVPIVEQALIDLQEAATPTTLGVNPLDAELVTTHLRDWIERRRLEVRADPSITVGGCRLSNPLTEIDATLETRWSRVLEAIGWPATSIIRTPHTKTETPALIPAGHTHTAHDPDHDATEL